MTTRVIALTEHDWSLIQEFLNLVRRGPPRGPLNSVSNPGETDGPAPELYVALTPPQGIPALVDVIPGSAFCGIQRITFVEADGQFAPVIEAIDTQQLVLNLLTVDLPGDTFLAVAREKFGAWLALATLASPSTPDETDTGTGTGTSTAGDEDEGDTGTSSSTGTGTTSGAEFSWTDYKTICEGGTLNLYSRDITIRSPLSDSSIGDWEFESAQGCCDCGEASTGTATSTTNSDCPGIPGVDLDTLILTQPDYVLGVRDGCLVKQIAPDLALCDPITINETTTRCEKGLLNLYFRTITIGINPASGCLSKSAGAWTFSETIACCTTDCLETTGTATATSTSSATSSSVGHTGTSSSTGTSTSPSSTGTGTGTTTPAYWYCVSPRSPSTGTGTGTSTGTGTTGASGETCSTAIGGTMGDTQHFATDSQKWIKYGPLAAGTYHATVTTSAAAPYVDLWSNHTGTCVSFAQHIHGAGCVAITVSDGDYLWVEVIANEAGGTYTLTTGSGGC